MRRGQRGFSLIELLVVMVIIAILVLVAIPAITSHRSSARVAAVQSDVRNAGTAAESYYVTNSAYPADGTVVTQSSPGFARASSGVTLTVATSADRLCISGQHPAALPASLFYYSNYEDATAGAHGVERGVNAGTCATGTYHEGDALTSEGMPIGSTSPPTTTPSPTPTTPPTNSTLAAPTGVAVTGSGTDTVVRWDAVSGATSYVVSRSLVSSSGTALGAIQLATVTGTTYADSAPLVNYNASLLEYRYSVTPVNYYGFAGVASALSAAPVQRAYGTTSTTTTVAAAAATRPVYDSASRTWTSTFNAVAGETYGMLFTSGYSGVNGSLYTGVFVASASGPVTLTAPEPHEVSGGTPSVSIRAIVSGGTSLALASATGGVSMVYAPISTAVYSAGGFRARFTTPTFAPNLYCTINTLMEYRVAGSSGAWSSRTGSTSSCYATGPIASPSAVQVGTRYEYRVTVTVFTFSDSSRSTLVSQTGSLPGPLSYVTVQP